MTDYSTPTLIDDCNVYVVRENNSVTFDLCEDTGEDTVEVIATVVGTIHDDRLLLGSEDDEPVSIVDLGYIKTAAFRFATDLGLTVHSVD